MEPSYTTAQLLEVSGLTHGNFKQLIGRGHLRLSKGRPGSGQHYRHDKTDVLQARLLSRLGHVGVVPHRAAMFWNIVSATLHHPEALLLLSPREDGSDTDFRLVLPGGDAGMEHPDAPGVLAVINIGALKREVLARLDALV